MPGLDLTNGYWKVWCEINKIAMMALHSSRDLVALRQTRRDKHKDLLMTYMMGDRM